ncbi:MAG: TerB family tellurite resistance protein [Phycisphaerales bacterium]
MIIYGWRGVTKTVDRGNFFCPQCNAEQGYQRKSVRRFFTLYFIPVIPLNKLGEFVRCDACRGDFREEVLQADPRHAAGLRDAVRDAIRRVMVAIAAADGRLEDNEVSMLRHIYLDLTKTTLDEWELRNEIDAAVATPIDLGAELGPMAPHLSDEGKDLVLRAALLIAGADGHVDEKEMATITRVAGILNVAPDRFDAILGAYEQAVSEEP